MQDIRILTTGAGAPGANGIFKSFRIGAKNDGRKIEIIASDMDENVYGFQLTDKGYKIPRGESPDFVDKLLEICKKESPNLLISWVTPELLSIAKNRSRFEELGVNVVLSYSSSIEISENKGKIYEMFKEFGYVPDYRIVNNLEELKSAISSLGYPGKTVCFKPIYGHGGRGFRIIKSDINRMDLLFKEKPNSVFTSLEEIKKIFENRDIPKLIVMEYLEGKEYTVDMLLNKNEPVITIPRERVLIKMGISNVAKLEKNQDIIEASEAIAKIIGFNYNINMQFLYSPGQKPKLIEIQPRLAGTVVASVGAGANLPYLSLKMAMGEEIPEVNVNWNTVMKRFWEEIYVTEDKKWIFR